MQSCRLGQAVHDPGVSGGWEGVLDKCCCAVLCLISFFKHLLAAGEVAGTTCCVCAQLLR